MAKQLYIEQIDPSSNKALAVFTCAVDVKIIHGIESHIFYKALKTGEVLKGFIWKEVTDFGNRKPAIIVVRRRSRKSQNIELIAIRIFDTSNEAAAIGYRKDIYNTNFYHLDFRRVDLSIKNVLQ